MYFVYFWLNDTCVGFTDCETLAEAEGRQLAWILMEGKGAMAEVTTKEGC